MFHVEVKAVGKAIYPAGRTEPEPKSLSHLRSDSRSPPRSVFFSLGWLCKLSERRDIFLGMPRKSDEGLFKREAVYSHSSYGTRAGAEREWPEQKLILPAPIEKNKYINK